MLPHVGMKSLFTWILIWTQVAHKFDAINDIFRIITLKYLKEAGYAAQPRFHSIAFLGDNEWFLRLLSKSANCDIRIYVILCTMACNAPIILTRSSANFANTKQNFSRLYTKCRHHHHYAINDDGQVMLHKTKVKIVTLHTRTFRWSAYN